MHRMSRSGSAGKWVESLISGMKKSGQRMTKLFVVAYSNVPENFAEKLVIAYKWDGFSSLIYCRKE